MFSSHPARANTAASDIGVSPDISTSSSAHRRRFAGAVGVYLLDTQAAIVSRMRSPSSGQSVLEVDGGNGRLLDAYRDLDMQVSLMTQTVQETNR